MEKPLSPAISSKLKNQSISHLIFRLTVGKGVSATVGSSQILAGNLALLAQHHVSIPKDALQEAERELEKGCTIVYLAEHAKFAGYLVLSDTLRTESKQMIASLSDLHVQPVLLTGDNEKAASSIAAQLGISTVQANCLPEDKLHYIAAYQNEQHPVCMIGDGVNDAPALKAANVGIAMGGIGSATLP